MSMTKTHDLIATVGKYMKDGEEKKRYVNVGAGFCDDQGRLSIKLETVPVGPEWSGWLSLYPVKERAETRPAAARQSAPAAQEDNPFA